MKSIIEQFYYGELKPCEMPVPNTKKYKETLALLAQTEEEFVKRFPETKNSLTELKDLMHTISALESLNDFSRGFRFGAKLMLDVLGKDESK